jgi:helicase-exonuclease AddAB, AddA subunit, Firmicutes type
MTEIIREEKDMKYTDEQWNAIAARDRNILVSAAAGSGKTAVLVRRITRMLIDGTASVDRMLIVTFTKAAAAEMKEKIVDSINDEISRGGENEAALRKQLDIMYKAHISTFDSFAFEVVKRYFHIIGCDSNLSICDENDAAIMKSDALDEVFEDLFENEQEDFEQFLLKYGSFKNDDQLKKDIIKLYENIRTIPDYMDWFRRSAGKLMMTEDEFWNSDMASIMETDILNKLHEAFDIYNSVVNLAGSQGVEFQMPVLRQDTANVLSLLELTDPRQLRTAICAFSQPKLRTAGKNVDATEKCAYEEIKDQIQKRRKKAKGLIDNIRNRYFSDDMSNIIACMNDTYGEAIFLGHILECLEEKYSAAKLEKNIADFADIEHYAIRILENGDAAAEYKNLIDYIFIDEYQDSNLLQEKIIDSIRQEGNVFMVGDIKQSIYRFRLADPSIFTEKYNRYVHYDANGDHVDSKIDLNKNFRSKGGVVRAVNDVFAEVMEGYDENAELHKGVDCKAEFEYRAELCVVDCAEEEDAGLDSDLLNMKKEELEALAAVAVIRNNVGKTVIWDVRRKCARTLQLSDIVILMRSAVNYADIFYQTLRDNGIECYLDNNGGYFDRIEIMTFTDLLRVTDNIRQDVPLLGVLRSPIFGFSIDELIAIRTAKEDVPFYDAFISCAASGEDEKLKEKAAGVLSALAAWKEEAGYLPVDEFVWKLMNETDYYTYAGTMPGGRIRQTMLRVFVEKAGTFSLKGDNTIYGLIRYIDNMKIRSIDLAQPNVISENDDVVRIMTIHKSKGLEFPMVILAGLGKDFRSGGSGGKWSFHNRIGIGMRYYDLEGHWFRDTISKSLIDMMNQSEEMDEERRLLYVAFTRAEDKLVLLGTSKDWKKDRESYESGDLRSSNAMDLIYPAVMHAPDDFAVSVFRKSDLDEITPEQQAETDNILELIRGKGIEQYLASRDEVLHKEVSDRLSYVYPYRADMDTKSKYSVSELNRTERTQEITLKVPAFTIDKPDFTAAEKGTIMHSVMEHIDFGKVWEKTAEGPESVNEYITGFVREMTAGEMLTAEEAATVVPSKISSFFATDVGKRAAKAEICHKERPFTAEHVISPQSSPVLVQGVIDCYFEEDGELVLIDYKTNTNVEGIRETYREQIDLYKEALQMLEGKTVKEAYLYLFAKGRFIAM